MSCIFHLMMNILLSAQFVLSFISFVLFFLSVLFPLIVIYLRRQVTLKRNILRDSHKDKIIVGLFHPYCNAGGGGERVLWCAIKSLQKRHPSAIYYIYTGDLEAFPEAILKNVRENFSINLDDKSIKFIYLRRRKWVEGSTYPYFTLLAQSLGSMWLGLEALDKLQPDIMIDTMGYAFAYPIFKYIGQCKVACYTHYPTVTADMLRRVYSRFITHNNRRMIANSPFLTSAKVFYYKIFGKVYGIVGRCSDAIMVNSSWTEDHINEIWNVPMRTHRVYPPCDVENLKQLTRLPYDKIKIISVGQFRPEKNHPLQLRAMYELRTILNEKLFDRVELCIIGSCRNSDDQTRVQDMEDLCKHLSLENHVKFKINISYDELHKEFRQSTIGIHSMWNEHFGIGIVECMAAGLIMVAHKSGGPLRDIIETSEPSKTGYLATTDQEYACAIAAIIYLNEMQRASISAAARASVDRFSEEEFDIGFARVMAPLFD